MIPSATVVDADIESGACMYHFGTISAAFAVFREVQLLGCEKLMLMSWPYRGQSHDVGFAARAGVSAKAIAKAARRAAGRRRFTESRFRAQPPSPCRGSVFRLTWSRICAACPDGTRG